MNWLDSQSEGSGPDSWLTPTDKARRDVKLPRDGMVPVTSVQLLICGDTCKQVQGEGYLTHLSTSSAKRRGTREPSTVEARRPWTP